jgi:hypothetical protein
MPSNLRSLVALRLPRMTCSSQTAWDTAGDEVVEWVKYGLSDRDPSATILGVGLFLHRPDHPDDGSPPIRLGVVIDMLLSRLT